MTLNKRRPRISFPRSRRFGRIFSKRVLDWLGVISVTIAIVFAFALFSLVAVQLSLLLNVQPTRFWSSITNIVFYIIGVQPSNREEYVTAVTVALNATLVIVSILFAVVPFYNGFLYRRHLRSQQSITLHPVHVEGVDDIKIMKKYYENAESVLIFSGDFSWLKDNVGIREELIANLNRVTFVSYRSEEVVREAIGQDLFNRLRSRFVFNCRSKLKCSLVKYSVERVFLYKTYFPPVNDVSSAVCVVTPSPDSQYLLQALEQLCEEAMR